MYKPTLGSCCVVCIAYETEFSHIKLDDFTYKFFLGGTSHSVHGCAQGVGEDQGCSGVAVDTNIRVQEVGF